MKLSLETLSHLETVLRQYFHCLGLGLEGNCFGLDLGLEYTVSYSISKGSVIAHCFHAKRWRLLPADNTVHGYCKINNISVNGTVVAVCLLLMAR